MLCFLPPIMPLPRSEPPRRTPPRCGAFAATVMIVTLVGAALLTPFGWSRTQPIYALRVGTPSALSPRPEDADLKPRFDRVRAASGDLLRPITFGVRRQRSDAIPPGLRVDAQTGALVGTPTMAGTYTLAVAVSDGATEPLVGSPFQVRVLPSP